LTEQTLSWMIGGKAGYGINVSGIIFAKAFSHGGFNVFGTTEYPSLIRGGHNTYNACISSNEIHSTTGEIDLLVALNTETVELHWHQISPGGGIIFDGKETDAKKYAKKVKLYNIPIKEIAKEAGGSEIMVNTAAIGASIFLTGYDFSLLEGVLKQEFKGKGKKIVEQNIAAAKKGYEYAEKNFGKSLGKKIIPVGKKRMLITGNEAISIGAINAGMKLYAAYPMTPASSILHYMAAHSRAKGIVVKQTEDEIAAIHTAIGASFAGVRAMTATSGGGFSLMAEGLGLAGLTETPLVLVESQRPGPSTGLATRTEQGDLRFVMHASQGEFPRIILAPGDAKEAFYLTEEAFNLAEKYQVPVIIMSDKHLSESHFLAEKFLTNYKIDRGKLLDEKKLAKIKNYKRFEFTKDGISYRNIPGNKKGIFRVPSYERDEYGWMTEDPKNRKKMVDQRMMKEKTILGEIPLPKIYGKKNAKITFVSWGSTKGAILDAIKILEKEKISANLIHYNYILPFRKDSINLLKKANKIIVVEQNKTLQFAGVIREETGFEIKNSFSKYTGRQMIPKEICEAAKRLLHV
jgi:2-oxoglutarate/2-oxoacid ferredoxin oxidoreductase subunit alpha